MVVSYHEYASGKQTDFLPHLLYVNIVHLCIGQWLYYAMKCENVNTELNTFASNIFLASIIIYATRNHLVINFLVSPTSNFHSNIHKQM